MGDTTGNQFACSSRLVQRKVFWRELQPVGNFGGVHSVGLAFVHSKSTRRIDALLAAETCSLVTQLYVESYILLFSDVEYNR